MLKIVRDHPRIGPNRGKIGPHLCSPNGSGGTVSRYSSG
jgi:hypothetical protein